MIEFKDAPAQTRGAVPTSIDGVKVCVIGDPVAHHADGRLWQKLHAYERGDKRRWLFCQETGTLIEQSDAVTEAPLLGLEDPPLRTAREAPAEIDGVKVCVVGDLFTHHADARHWLRLRTYGRDVKLRQWLFCPETGALVEGTPQLPRTRHEPPGTIDGTKVHVVGDPLVHHVDGKIWLKLRAYERGDGRRWLYCQETDSLIESEPE